METLTIRQIGYILSMSYPTALKLATVHGQQDEDGLWHVPASIVEARIEEMLQAAQAAKTRLLEATK
jgi:hypothetical protein